MNGTGESFALLFLFLIYGAPLLLALLGFVVGGLLEQRHFAAIRKREATFAYLPVFPTRGLDSDRECVEGQLVVASVVVSIDYFKKILARLRNLFGGNVLAYESLLDRAKREAILRLKAQAPDCHAIINLRIDTAKLASIHDPRQRGIAGVEVIAYGTAIRYK